MTLRTDVSAIKLTKAQRCALIEAGGPRLRGFLAGGGMVVADPRVLRALVNAGLVNKMSYFRNDTSWLTEAGKVEAKRLIDLAASARRPGGGG